MFNVYTLQWAIAMTEQTHVVPEESHSRARELFIFLMRVPLRYPSSFHNMRYPGYLTERQHLTELYVKGYYTRAGHFR